MKYTHIYISFFSSLFSLGMLSQEKPEPIISNSGVLYIGPEKEVTVNEDFDNKQGGQMIVDGTVIYHKNFNNDDLYYYSKDKNTSKAIFQDELKSGVIQKITGSSPSEFYDIVFEKDNIDDDVAFNLQNDINIFGTAYFNNGRVATNNRENGSMVFHPGSHTKNASNESYGSMVMEKIGNEPFMFPKGSNKSLGYVRISAPPKAKDVYGAYYFNNNENFLVTRVDKEPHIDVINEFEYWLITKSEVTNKDQGVYITFSVREPTPLDLLEDQGQSLHVIYWNETKNIWEDKGGIVDIANKEVTTGEPITELGFFTVATIKPVDPLPDDIIIYNGVSANDDGQNDYFFIENITRFPENRVQIFNRWGQLVFSTSNYDSNGNVFNGYAQGKGVVINSGEKLPSGTYFYLVEYTIENENGKRDLKKSGYLHLETN